MWIRPLSRTFIAVLKPTPSTPPIKADAGIRQFSKITSQVCAPFWPIFLSRLPSEIPGNLLSTMNAEMAAAPFNSGLVRAITVNTPACGALVIKRLVPFRMYSSPSFTAVVFKDAASEPESGSVKQNEPMISPLASFGRKCCFCSSVPSMIRPDAPIPLFVPINERKAGEVRPSSKAI